MTDRLGQQFGNYRITARLGSGGFAEVYLGEHIHLGTQAALKIIQAQLSEEDVELFRVEARTIAALRHPHIVRILDFGVEEKIPFLVMDYAPHGTLRQRHPRQSQVPLEVVVAYVKQIGDALQYAHAEKIVHRDVKPENMLIGRENDILLSDFGIALLAQSSRFQNAQHVVGTIGYMAPEQIQASAQPASDQYALGIVVYEWLTGESPFQGTMVELIAKHLSAPPLPLHTRVPGLSLDVEEVVQTALAKDPALRFASVKAFATALELAAQASSHLSVPAVPVAQFDETTRLMPSSESQVLTQIIENAQPAATQPDETVLLEPSAESQMLTLPGANLTAAQPDETLLLAPSEDEPSDVTVENPPPAQAVASPPPVQPFQEEQAPAQFAAYALTESAPSAPLPVPPTTPVSDTPLPPPPPSYPYTPLPPPVYPYGSAPSPTYQYVPQSQPNWPAPAPQTSPGTASSPNYQYVPQSQPNWPPPPPQAPKPPVSARTRRFRILVAVVLALIVLGGIVGIVIVNLPPRPSISVSSSYQGNTGLGGPADTVLHVNGTGFTHDSAITFLLDNAPAPGAPAVQSDGSGNFQANVTITDDWQIAAHSFSAKDAAGYKPQQVARITVIPQPVLTITSKYRQGSTPASAPGATLSLTGRRFSPFAQITLLLDSQPFLSTASIQSDAVGRFQQDVPVTSIWTLGQHTLAARDDKGYGTQQAQALTIVAPGVADTPGPNGAPADDSTFSVYVSGHATDSDGQSYTYGWNLTITGRPDPQGGKVCSTLDGSAHTYHGTLYNINVGYTETITYACSGTYKSGHFTYTETATSDVFNLSDGEYCAASGPYAIAQIKGTFNSSSEVQGTYHRSYFQANCNGGRYIFRGAADSSWSGYAF